MSFIPGMEELSLYYILTSFIILSHGIIKMVKKDPNATIQDLWRKKICSIGVVKQWLCNLMVNQDLTMPAHIYGRKLVSRARHSSITLCGRDSNLHHSMHDHSLIPVFNNKLALHFLRQSDKYI